MIFTPNKTIFGLDISDRALRLIQLKKIGKKIFLNTYNDLALPADIIINGDIKKEEELIKILNQLIRSAKGKKIIGSDVITVLPESKTFIKVIEVTSPNHENLPSLISEELKKHIPLSTDEIYLDWQILSEHNQNFKLLIGAAPKTTVDSYLSVLEQSGLVPYIFEIEAAAITRSLLAENDKSAKIIIDFGAMRTGLIVYDHQAVQFEVSLPISGTKITETIAKTLKLSTEQAEKAKIVCGLDPQKCEGALLKILLKPIQDLADQIKKSILFYKVNFADANLISEIIISGGGANFANIDQVLADRLSIPVKIGNPLANINQTKKIVIEKNKILSYSTAIGLALRAFQKKDLI